MVTMTFPEAGGPRTASGQGLSGLAASLGSALRELVEGVDISGLEAQMHRALPEPDAVIFLEAGVASRLQGTLHGLLGPGRQLAVESHLRIDGRWSQLAIEVVSPRDRGGVLSGLGDDARRLEEPLEHIVVATDGLSVGAVDSLLLQLSIAELDSRSLLFLPSGDADVDDHLKTRAAFYGLSGQRPGQDGDLDMWIRGARAMIGRPSERQLVAALGAGTPTVWVGDLEGDSGHAWSVSQGFTTHARTPVEISVAIEGCLHRDAPDGIGFRGAARIADVLLDLIQGSSADEAAPGDQVSDPPLEAIGVATVEPVQSPEHERLEIDDALAQLKRRMGFGDDEG